MDIDRIITRLADATQRLPLDSMVSRVWLPGHPQTTQNIQELEAITRDAITQISTLAGAGRDDAIVALRNIGNHAVTELDSFILPQASKDCRRKISTTPGPFKESAILSLPVVEIEGDLSSIVEILSSEKQAIEKLSPGKINGEIEHRRIAGRGRFVVNALAGLGFPKELLDEHRLRTSEKSVYYNHPRYILEIQLAKTKTAEGKTDPTKRSEATRIELLKLIQHLLEARLEELAIAKGVELATNSMEWPMCISAFRRDVQKQVDSLNVGGSLPFRPRSLENITGRPPEVEPGSVIHFALEYCAALDYVRRMHFNSTKQQRAEWMKSIEGIEEAIKHGVGGDPNEKLLPHPYKPNSSDPYHGVSLCILWTCKAALLPAFPSACAKSNAEVKSDLELWIDAAMARARMICWNDWEGYIGWPKCVVARRFQSNKRGRSAQSIVREKIREGMMKLEPVSAANR